MKGICETSKANPGYIPRSSNWILCRSRRTWNNREVREVVRRLRYHPSIVLWCGNNENNWGFDEWSMGTHKVKDECLGNKL